MNALRALAAILSATAIAAGITYIRDPSLSRGLPSNFVGPLISAERAIGEAGPAADATASAHMLRAGTSGTASVSSLSAPHIRFAAVERGSIQQTATVTGTLQPVETVEVGSQLSGQVSKLYVDFNDAVRRGQPLAQIDPRTFQAKVDEARASLAMAEANVHLVSAKLDRAKVDLNNARENNQIVAAKLRSAEALKEAAARTLQRKLSLQARNVGPATDVDTAQTDLTAKTAQESEAKTMVALNANAVAGADADLRRTEAELEQATAAVPEKKAVLQAAEADLDRTIIRSPIDGVVVGRFVNQGQTLAVGLESRPVFTVAHRLEDMEIHARVDETDIGRIAVGQRAHFTVDAHPDRQFSAVVRQIRKAPQVTQNVVTYTVVLATSNPDGALLPGMTALVKIIIDQQRNVLKVPMAALRFQPKGAPRQAAAPGTQTVWVRTSRGELKRIAITVGTAGAEQVALKSGSLSEGDQVAIGQISPPSNQQWFGIRFGS